MHLIRSNSRSIFLHADLSSNISTISGSAWSTGSMPCFPIGLQKTSFSSLTSDKLQFLSDTVAVRVNKNKILLVRVRDTPRILNKISQFEGLKAFNAFNNNIEYLSHIDILRIMVYLLNSGTLSFIFPVCNAIEKYCFFPQQWFATIFLLICEKTIFFFQISIVREYACIGHDKRLQCRSCNVWCIFTFIYYSFVCLSDQIRLFPPQKKLVKKKYLSNKEIGFSNK